MGGKGVSLKSSARKTVLQHYRSRGHSNNNIWLIYSVKTDSDWILNSDRLYIYWLYFLEFNPEVVSFDLSPDFIKSDKSLENDFKNINSTVSLKDGSIEWHEIRSGDQEPDSIYFDKTSLKMAALIKQPFSFKFFNDLKLKPVAKIALRLAKALTYAATIRDVSYAPSRTALVMSIHELKKGVIRQLLEKLNAYDQSVILGLIVRLTIEGVMRLDLDKSTFGLSTKWTLQDD